jgi:hypothetical protein
MMYRMDNVPVTETKRRIPMDVLVVLQWAKATIDALRITDGMHGLLDSESDRAHWEALTELCEER